jgi:hypothetical protein
MSRDNKIAQQLWSVQICSEMTDRMEMFIGLLFGGFEAIRHLVEIFGLVQEARLEIGLLCGCILQTLILSSNWEYRGGS